VMTYFALIGPVFLYVAIRPGGGKWRDVWRVYFAPTAASVIAIGVAILFGRWIQKMQLTNDAVRQVLRLVVIMLWSIVLYIPLIRIMAPSAFKELIGRLEAVFKRKVGTVVVATAQTGPAPVVAGVQQN